MVVRPTARAKKPTARAAEKPQWAFRGASIDPLVAAMSACAKLFGREIQPETLTAGVALPGDGLFTPQIALGVAENVGFRAHLTRRRLADLPEAVLPCILFLTDRQACVLVRLGKDECQIIWPARSDDPITVSTEELRKSYVGHALLLRQPVSETTAAQPAETTLRHWYWSIARKFWPDYAQVILASIVINLLALASPIFTMNVYDRVFPNAAIITLWSLVAGVGIALVFDAILKWVRSSVVDRVSRQVDQSVSASIFRHISDLRLESLTQPSGVLMNNLKDYEQVRDFFSSQTVATITDLLFSVLFIGVIYYVGGPLAYPPAIAFVTVILIGLLVLFPLRKASNDTRANSSIKNAVAVEAVAEMETLKAISGQGRMQGRWEKSVTESARTQERTRKLSVFATTVTTLAQQFSSIGIVVTGVYLALDGSITMGAVIAAMILSGRALAPTAALSALFTRASFAFSTLKSLNTLMSLPSDATASAQKLNTPVDDGAYELKDVSLQYSGTEIPSLREVSLTTKSRERIALIGPVGAGKTSLVRLMAGLYAPSEGLVLIDGLNLSQISPVVLRSHVQLVPQDAVLFSGTLAENIAFGVPHATMQDVLRAARTAGVDRLAAKHPEGFAMPILERGKNLSGGQRQMIALARALLPRPDVLILDEPTSSMDSQSEKLFIQRLKAALEERPMTLIVSTHRMGLLELTDRVVFLDQGRVIADGPKEDVLDRLSTLTKAVPK
ncbi:type I secretion system permease/ATPase [Falsihalocynthiibacter sp. SS001]|uniref:type I secretion system permease/ATPase n=1 Tax=Falsihalocynthiibacter sp. SS001 TaxID=3349698 RepID=UPI0036D3C5AC